ncbi:MAG: hypothetical protein QNJ85_08520 [Gammaproteobacteria bacterium]|nr:hypothetical protein [Gammaproteobacteria bacterium]
MKVCLRALFYGLVLLMVAACEPADTPPGQTEQAYYFIEALKQVERGGQRLQSADLDRATVASALAELDAGLELAFRVEREFLDSLDLRLGKNFERYFIQGVENYRLGIEAGDKEQQRAGLVRLQRWGEFWQSAGTDILALLEEQ